MSTTFIGRHEPMARQKENMQPVKSRELSRQEVLRILAKSISNHRLTVVAAPAGYGKTTIAQRLLGNNGKNRFYYSVPEDIADAAHLWDSLCASLARQGMEAAPTLRRMGFPQSESMTRRIIEFMADISPPFTLIIDDYQNYLDAAVDAFMETLVRSEPSEHRFVLFSRVKPRIDVDSLEAAGLAAFHDQKLLEFTKAETARFFFLNGVSDKATVDRAWRYSEGWATALWLYLQNDRSGGTSPPAGDIHSLLDRAVFAAYPAEDRKFLMKLSVLDSFTVTEAEAVLAVPDVRGRLREMSDGNALIRFDAEAGKYVFHSIFRDFLAEKLAGRDDLNVPELYRRAAECLVERREFMAAYRLLTKAGRDEDLVRILDVQLLQNGQNLVGIHWWDIYDIVQAIPWRLRFKQPLGYLVFIWYNFVDGFDSHGINLLEDMDRRFQRAREIPTFLKRRLAGEVEFMRGWLHLYEEFDMVVPRYRNACELIDGPTVIRYDRMCWNFCSPSLLFIHLMSGFRFHGEIFATTGLIGGLLRTLTGGVAEGFNFLLSIEYHLERGEFEETRRLLDDADQLLDLQRNATSAVVARFARARLLAAAGKPEDGVAVLRELLPVAEAADSYEHIQSIELALGYALASALRPDAAPKWLLDQDIFGYPYGDTRIQCFMATVCGRLLLERDDTDGLAAFLSSRPGIFGPVDLVFSGMNAAAFAGILAWRRNDVDGALAELRRALEISRPDGYLLCLAEYGRHILPPLRRLEQEAPDDAHLKKLLELAETIERVQRRQEEKNKCLLSERECEVMALVVKGKSTSAIARKTGVGESAVKKRLSAAYRKLSAKNRAQAAYRFQIDYLGKQEDSAGVARPDGTNGPDGANGTNGADGTRSGGDHAEAASLGVFPLAGKSGDSARWLESFTLAGAGEVTARCFDKVRSTAEALPWSVRSMRPMGYLACLWWLFRMSGARLSGLLVDEAEHYFSGLGTHASRLRRRLAGELALLRGLHNAHNTPALWDSREAALSLLRGPSELYSRQTSWTLGNPSFSFAAVRGVGEFAALAARAAQASATLSTLTGGAFASLETAVRMELHLERGEMDKAGRFLPEMAARRDDDLQAVVTGAFAGARLAVAKGQASGAAEPLEKLRWDAERLGSHEHSESLELALGFMYAQLGDVDKIAPWLRSGKVNSPPHGAAARRPFALVVYGKALAAAREFRLLDSVARTLPERFGLYESLFGRIHAKVLEAVAARHVRDDAEALEHLRAALDLSRHDGLTFSIAEYGGLILPLLRRLRREEPGDRHLERVAILADRMRRNAAGSTKRTAKVATLTRREREIMQSVVQGKSNPLIAKELGVSVSFVQKTLSSVYVKLSAANRAEASRSFNLQYGAR